MSAHVVSFTLAKIPVGFNFEVFLANWRVCPILLSLIFCLFTVVKLLISRISNSGFHSLETSPFEMCDLFTLGFLETLAFHGLLVRLDLWAMFGTIPCFV